MGSFSTSKAFEPLLRAPYIPVLIECTSCLGRSHGVIITAQALMRRTYNGPNLDPTVTYTWQTSIFIKKPIRNNYNLLILCL
jgi:hypothetical protein